MSSFCVVVRCSISAAKRGTATQEFLEKKRRSWLKAINRKGFDFNTVKTYHRLCSDYFISGQPAYEQSENDPDWVSSINMWHDLQTDVDAAFSKHERAVFKERERWMLQHPPLFMKIFKCQRSSSGMHAINASRGG
ncbi:hypothetical protein RRG08_025131 [Elysia crispata]|uniref:THAP-type domain-containing protein n=1 Tax=Elysia crispata TaxID=231223 RepID=A0AAE0ZUI8_9GAST|nr:hypothetical protein RRG08_025131 [Elysia crispata]